MSEASISDPYDVVLADLRAQRAKIDQAISALESLRGAKGGPAPGQPDAAAAPSGVAPSGGLGPGAFLGITIVDAAKKLLVHERRQLTNAEMLDAFKRGGLVLNSAEPLNTIGSVLNRRFKDAGDIVRVGRGTWGLKEWYPNRSFKTAKAGETKDSGPEITPAVPADFSNTFGAGGNPAPDGVAEPDSGEGAGNP